MTLKYAPALTFLALTIAQTAWANGIAVELGRERAVAYCSACHQVTKEQAQPAPVPYPEENADVVTPSFHAIAIKYEGRETELREFIKAPAHPMKEQEFLKEDLDAIVAYIRSADKHW